MRISSSEVYPNLNWHSNSDRIILIYHWAMSPNEYKSLVSIIDKMPGVRAICISQDLLELGQRLNKLVPSQDDQMRIFWDKFCETSINYKGEHPEIFANTHLQFQFKRIKEEMEKAIDYGDVFAALLDILQPSLIFFAHDAFTIERILVRVARNRSIPSLSLVHGTLRLKASMRNIIGEADLKLTSCDKDIEWMLSYGVEKDRVYKIGSLEYEAAYKEYLKTSHQRFNGPNKKKKIALGLNKKLPVITMCTAEISSGLMTPVASGVKHRVALREFLFFVKSRQDLQFIIKAHPGGDDYYWIYKSMLNHRLPNLVFNDRWTLKDVLDVSDVFFMINYCTTAAVEAMLSRVPVIFFDNAIFKMEAWRDNLEDTSIRRVKTIDELEYSIDELLLNPDIRNNVLSEAEIELKILLGYEYAYANENLTDLILSMLSNRKNDNIFAINNKKGLQELLYSKSNNFASYRRDLIKRHSSYRNMIALSFLSGNFGLSISGIFRIFEIFNPEKRSNETLNWNEVRWHLLQAHIEGSNDEFNGCGFLNGIRVLIIYITNPRKFMIAPLTFKRGIFKYLIQNILRLNLRLLSKIHFDIM
jgi:hypothetical protein